MSEYPFNIGVSPAFLISSFGNHFTADHVCEAMERAACWGFKNIQIEIYDDEKLARWLEGNEANRVKKVAETLGMNISQLVGHLLIEDCASRSALFSPSGIETMAKLVTIATALGRVESITLPVGKFSPDEYHDENPAQINDEGLKRQLAKKLYDFYRPVEAAGYRLAVELLPGNAVGGYSGFAKIQEQVASDRLGLLFDTGHAWAAAEDIYSIPQRFKGAIFGTHLCDNFGDRSIKLAPGQGSIDWNTLLKNLAQSQYAGFLDLEIICQPDEVENQYRSSQEFIKSLLRRVVEEI